MAKKAKGGAGRGKKSAPEPEAPAVNGAMTKPSLVKSLAMLKRSTVKQTQALAGTFGERVANAVEHQKLHKKAFSMACSLDKLEPEQLAELFPHFDHYCDVLKLRERAGSAPRMDMNNSGGDEDDEAGEDEPARRTGNVRDFPNPRAEAAE